VDSPVPRHDEREATALATLVYRGVLNYSGADALSPTLGNGGFNWNVGVAITVISAAQQAADLEVLVNALVAAGRLTAGQGEALNLNLRGNNSDAALRQKAADLFDALNQAGSIG
jgi:hypothetical protein